MIDCCNGEGLCSLSGYWISGVVYFDVVYCELVGVVVEDYGGVGEDVDDDDGYVEGVWVVVMSWVCFGVEFLEGCEENVV